MKGSSPRQCFSTNPDVSDCFGGYRLPRIIFTDANEGRLAGTPPGSPLRRFFDAFSRKSNPIPGSGYAPRRFSVALMEENVDLAEKIISNSMWVALSPEVAPPESLFSANPDEASRLLHAVADLREAIIFFSDDYDTRSDYLFRSNALMDAAMCRLQHEFRLTIANDESPALFHSRNIAEAMCSSGYDKECIRTFKSVRRPLMSAKLDDLKLERLTRSHVHKLSWAALERKISAWRAGIHAAVTGVFAGERAVCSQIFSDLAVVDGCFSEVAGDTALIVVSFPEFIVTRPRSRKLKKLFMLLDLYDALFFLLEDINSVFSGRPIQDVRAQAILSLEKLSKAVIKILANLEAAIENDSSRVPPGGDVLPIARYVISYVILLSGYKSTLEKIFSVEVGSMLGRLLKVLLQKLDDKSGLFGNDAMLNLFLVNNLDHVATKVIDSPSLKEMIGEEWVRAVEGRARKHASSYARQITMRLVAAIQVTLATEKEAEERLEAFMTALEEMYVNKYQKWKVAVELETRREYLRASVAKAVMPEYRRFYWRCRRLLSRRSAAWAALLLPVEVRSLLSDAFGTGKPESMPLLFPSSKSSQFAKCFPQRSISNG